MTLCILEGCDGTGKSTLAERLSKKYEKPVLHDGPPEDPSFAFVELCRDLLDCPRSCVWDRWHFGNQVYGSIFRGKPDLAPIELELFEEMLLKRGVLLVLCQPSLDEVRENIGVRAAAGKLDDRGFEDDWVRTELIYHGMQVMYSITKLPKMIYDYQEEGSLEDVYAAVERELGWVG